MGNSLVVEQQQRLSFSSIPTQEILDILEAELHKTITTIQNMKRLRNFGDGGRAYICQLMRDTEEILHTFNAEMQPQHGNTGTPQGSCSIELHKQMEDKNKQLKKNNETLLQNKQENESIIQRQQQTIKYFENDQRKDNIAPKTAAGDRSISQSEKPAINQRQQQSADSLDSGSDEMIATTFDKTQGELQNEHYTEIEKLQKQYSDMEADFKRQKLEFMEEQQILRAQKETLESHAISLQKEKDTLLRCFSKIAGDKLVNNNPAITDLSDPDRSTKLGEIYSEIYDNEWTDAVEALQTGGYDEETAIETLRLTLENVIQFCESKAEVLIKKASDAVNLLFEEFRMSVEAKKMPSHLRMPRKQAQEIGQLLREKSFMVDIRLQLRWKTIRKNTEGGQVTQTPEKTGTAETNDRKVDNKLRQFRKEMATSMVPIVQKAYIEASWTNDCIQDLKPYIMKCLYLGWMMVVQSPPMVLHKCPSGKEIKFDKNVHKEYTASGPLVSYVVWPALLLNENGPVVCKGVAQGKKPNTKYTK